MSFLASLVRRDVPSDRLTNLTLRLATTALLPLMLVVCGCPTAATGPQGPQGETGPQGPAGADGQLRIYGDGSDGAQTVSTSTDLETFVTNNNIENLQFTDFTVSADVTLTIPSGTVIRCSGTFTNNGTIQVQTGALGASRFGVDIGISGDAVAPAHPGQALRAAASGQIGSSDSNQEGGFGGEAPTTFQASSILMPGVAAGGGGGAGVVLGFGGSGGGSLVVLAQTAIVNAGTITADGENSTLGGGGAGGIIVLASQTTVTNSGTIRANGGSGAPGGSSYGPSAGAGGGIIHLLAPSITAGTLTVSPGAAGANTATLTATVRSGGGGGGACGGDGGKGGTITAPGTIGDATVGLEGVTIQSLVDPTALF